MKRSYRINIHTKRGFIRLASKCQQKHSHTEEAENVVTVKSVMLDISAVRAWCCNLQGFLEGCSSSIHIGADIH